MRFVLQVGRTVELFQPTTGPFHMSYLTEMITVESVINSGVKTQELQFCFGLNTMKYYNQLHEIQRAISSN